MSLLKIVYWPNKVLETKAKEVTVFDESLRQFVRDMHETMEKNVGIGLAANQVGDLRRIFVLNISSDPADKDEDKIWWMNKAFTFINPEIIAKKGKARGMEGCLSFPDIYEFVDRAEHITVRYQDEYGKEHQIEADDLFSVCIQHELDHINGIVFINRMSRLKAALINKKLRKRQQLTAGAV